jgi:hypothetical protein
MWEDRMKLSVKTWVAILVLAVVGAPGAERKPVSVLSRPVSHFSIGQTSVLNALLWLGHDEGVSLGIEFSGQDLSREVQVAANMTTMSEAVKKILGSSSAYLLYDSHGVVLIRKKGIRPPAWLDHRLPQFEMPRMELMTAGYALCMRLELDLNPTIGGFAGDLPVTDPIDEVGPFHERGQTVRQLLIRIVASSRSAAWFPSIPGDRISFPSSTNRFWTLTATSGRCGNRPK